MKKNEINWESKHILSISSNQTDCSDEVITETQAIEKRKEVEPWLSAIFQSEHFSLLAGSGLTSATCFEAGVKPIEMDRFYLESKYKKNILDYAEETAKIMERGEANIEDDIRAVNDLITGLKILGDKEAENLKTELDIKLHEFVKKILKTENEFYSNYNNNKDQALQEKAIKSFNLLKSFLLSFSSRASSRERLNIFTTNYDRFIELASDDSGIILLDRFKGKILPIFRNTRLELDYHYNPPGIRGEPRYVEGVVRISKLHGSIDWRFNEKGIIRDLLPFGAEDTHPAIPKKASESVVIFPNSSKDIETAFYPYAELFRDFSSSICRPNSVVVTYGYGFGDSHINRILIDMLTIPSTHLVIIAWDIKDKNGKFGPVRDRIYKFYESVGNSAQFTLLIGEHYADLHNLVNYYLPKSAIDRLTIRKQKLIEDRGDNFDKNKTITNNADV